MDGEGGKEESAVEPSQYRVVGDGDRRGGANVAEGIGWLGDVGDDKEGTHSFSCIRLSTIKLALRIETAGSIGCNEIGIDTRS